MSARSFRHNAANEPRENSALSEDRPFGGAASSGAPFDECTRACEPYVAPDPDLTGALAESIAALRCVTCGDRLDPADRDNRTRPAGWNRAGRTDCGKCVRGMGRGAS